MISVNCSPFSYTLIHITFLALVFLIHNKSFVCFERPANFNRNEGLKVPDSSYTSTRATDSITEVRTQDVSTTTEGTSSQPQTPEPSTEIPSTTESQSTTTVKPTTLEPTTTTELSSTTQLLTTISPTTTELSTTEALPTTSTTSIPPITTTETTLPVSITTSIPQVAEVSTVSPLQPLVTTSGFVYTPSNEAVTSTEAIPTVYEEGSGSDIQKATKCSNNFAGSLYYVLSEMYPNFSFSPVTIGIMMALLLRGSDGSTIKELYSVMNYNSCGFGDQSEQVIDGFNQLSQLFNQPESSAIRVFSSLWIDDGKKINSMFLEDAASKFQTKLFPISTTSKSGDAIRSMIIKHSEDEMGSQTMSCTVKYGSIEDNPQIIILNSINFKGNFDSEKSRKTTSSVQGTFDSHGYKLLTTFIKFQDQFNYISSERFKSELIEIPLQSSSEKSNFSLIIILPKVEYGLKQVEESIDSLEAVLKEVKTNSSKKLLKVMIPKYFNKKSMKMNKLLKMLGIHTIFDPERSELTAISAYEKLSISSIFHESSFDLLSNSDSCRNEDGNCNIEYMNMSSIDKDTFHANRPFIYLITDRTTGCVVIVGRVINIS